MKIYINKTNFLTSLLEGKDEEDFILSYLKPRTRRTNNML